MELDADTESKNGIERWRGRVALVTGASSGIGREVVRSLVGHGLLVGAAARRQERLSALRDELGDSVFPLLMDVSDEDSVRAGLRTLEERFQRLDVLVNNAGLGHQESLLSGSTARFREMLEVNLLGLCVVTREAVASIRKQTEGHVFHLGSMAGHRIAPGSNLYGATKYAVRALTESLRQELHAEGLPIRVTSVSPGFVETEFHEKYFRSQEQSRELYTSQKVLEARDIADAIVYALGAPSHVGVHDILIRGLAQGT